jgi:hypothetical protein
MALPARVTSAYTPLAEDVLLLDAAGKDSTGTLDGACLPSSWQCGVHK